MKKGISILLVFLVLALFPCAALADTVTQEDFAAMQSLPDLYRYYGPVLRTYSYRSSESDSEVTQWLWYSKAKNGKPIFEFYDGLPVLAYDGFNYGYNEEGNLTAWFWLSGWEEAVESWSGPLLELPKEELLLVPEEDGSFSMIAQVGNEQSGWDIYGSLDRWKHISSVISLHYEGETVVREVLTVSPMEKPLVTMDLEALTQGGTRQVTCIRLDGTSLVLEIPQQLTLGWVENGNPRQVFLDPERTEAVTYIPAGADPVIIFE